NWLATTRSSYKPPSAAHESGPGRDVVLEDQLLEGSAPLKVKKFVTLVALPAVVLEGVVEVPNGSANASANGCANANANGSANANANGSASANANGSANANANGSANANANANVDAIANANANVDAIANDNADGTAIVDSNANSNANANANVDTNGHANANANANANGSAIADTNGNGSADPSGNAGAVAVVADALTGGRSVPNTGIADHLEEFGGGQSDPAVAQYSAAEGTVDQPILAGVLEKFGSLEGTVDSLGASLRVLAGESTGGTGMPLHGAEQK
ncbi:unnamed protein product, partial [Laminaria digitata]